MIRQRSDTDPFIVSRAICGRADLVRALAYADETLLLETAARLGYERRPPSPPSGSGGEQTGGTGSDNGERQGSAADVRLEVGPPCAIPFWQLVGRKFEVGPTRKPDDDTGSTVLPAWTRRPPALATARPLATWRELMPRLRRVLAEPAETHVLDVPAIVHRLGRGQSLERLPRQRRRRWGLSLHLIEDRSDHLAPYWGDQEQVRECLLRLFPHYAVAHALWFEGLGAPVWADGERSVGPYRPPPPGSLVVVLGDLGCLARGGADLRRHWLAMGQRLAADGCRTLALTPAPEGCPEALRRYWTPLPWERLVGVTDPETRQAQVQRLITLASSALRVETGLLRELRLLIGADAGTESAFWQEPAVIGKSSVAATLSAAEAQQRREAFARDDLKERALALLRDWRAGLPPEIWFAEIEALRPEERDHLPEESDVRQAAEFFAALGRQAAGVGGAAPVPGAIPWFREIAARLPEGYLDDPELGGYFHHLWTQILRRDPRALPPPGLHPEDVLTEAPARRVDLYQQGGALLFSSPALAAEMASPLASLESANGLIRIEEGYSESRNAFWRFGQSPEPGPPGGATGAQPHPLRLDASPSPVRCALPQAPAFLIHTDRERLTFRRLTKPAWASAIGRDRFGLWCEIAVDPGRGEPVVQRLRWIPPGRFWMGSPEEETRGLAKNDDERKWFEWEHPRHQVTLTEGYWLFDTPCTQALWEAVMEKNPSRFQSPTRPVEQVSWDEVQEFLKQLNGRIPDLDLVLPSEAQWEHACRAGTETAIYTGDLAILGANNAPALDPIAWYGGNSGVDFDLDNGYDSSGWPEKQYPHTKAGTRPVKLKRANPWGLYDMLGNVWEWCQDGMRDYDESARTNPTGSLEAGAARVLRGGSWDGNARCVRAAYRGHVHPGNRRGPLGFRCARVRGEPGQPAGKSDAPGAGAAPSGAPGRQGAGTRSERPAQDGRSTKTKSDKPPFSKGG